MLKTGDQVEIITAENETPKKEWLRFLQTRHARNVVIDYFKSSKGGRRQSRTQAQYEQREQASRDKNPFGDDYFKGKQQEQPKADQKNTARRTTTSSGVTIIDDRDQEEKRKIFDHSDGEYVEFEEV